MYSTLISVSDLAQQLNDPDWVIVDCRYDLMQAAAGRTAYLENHIPGAVYADVHDDLSGPPLTDHGRHPLPSAPALNKLFCRLGIDAAVQVVVYDAAGGCFAGRLWWLLHYMGHDAVALLDGGWQAWTAAGHQCRAGAEQNTGRPFSGAPRDDWLVRLEQVAAETFLVDSRDPARYRGEVEPVDRVAGHIPGAVNRFWQENLQADGRFKPAAVLREEFDTLYTQAGSGRPVFYCGSGVTACHNLLAVAHAGLQPARLYAGSWSEWCSDPEREVAT
ncbi:MAG: sulfurtransferase [Thiotrichales bacterium]|nr:sulfurtransferase [Thiotrichales bacterium]